MTKTTTDSFWKAGHETRVVDRRVLFPFGKRRGHVVLSLAENQPIPDLAKMSETMITEATIGTSGLKPGSALAPQFVFASVVAPKTGDQSVVLSHAGQPIPVIQLAAKETNDRSTLSFAAQMKQAQEAMPPAAAAAGDHAVGWLIRDHTLAFYPLVAVNLPQDVASFREGSGSTFDLMHLLPFQS